jgi:hypothetical protein
MTQFRTRKNISSRRETTRIGQLASCNSATPPAACRPAGGSTAWILTIAGFGLTGAALRRR